MDLNVEKNPAASDQDDHLTDPTTLDQAIDTVQSEEKEEDSVKQSKKQKKNTPVRELSLIGLLKKDQSLRFEIRKYFDLLFCYIFFKLNSSFFCISSSSLQEMVAT